MKTKYLFGAALLATAFTACTDEFLAEQNFANQENATYLNENFVLGVSLGDEVESRANWAGSSVTGKVSTFTNVYFSPKYNGTTDASQFMPSTNSEINGDQVGLTLIGNNKAIANIPFFIAGYESNARLAEGSAAPAAIYPLVDSEIGDLYYLGEENTTDDDKTALSYSSLVAQTLGNFNSAVTVVNENSWETNPTVKFDVTKGLFKCHIPVMSGTYFAYFPFNEKFLTQGNIPVPELEPFQEQAASEDNAHVAAKMFAYSSEMQSFDHTKVSGQFKMDKNAAVIFQVKLQNHAATDPADKRIKLVTLSVEGDDDAFVLEGTIGFNGTAASFVDGTKTAGIVGVELNPDPSDPGLDVFGEITPASQVAPASTIAYIATYPKADAAGAIVVRAYTVDGYVFERKLDANISNYKTGSNKAPIITMNLAALEEEVAENLAYDATSLKTVLSEVDSEEVVDVKLLCDIEVNTDIFASAESEKYNFEGGSLKFTASQTLPAEITFECPVTIENTSWSIGTDKKVVFNGGVTNKGTMSVEAKANVSATTFTNAGTAATLTVVGTALNKAVFSATTLENTGTVLVDDNSTFTVPTINNKKVTDVGAGKLTVNNALAGTAVAINNHAGATLNWGVAEIPSALTLTNAGAMTLNKWDGSTLVQNTATVTMKGATITNSGTINIALDERLDVATGTLSNSGDVTVVGKLNILQEATVTNTGAFREVGTMSGYNFITNSGDAAEFVKVVKTAAEFVAANNNDIYTAIEVAAAIDNNTAAVNVTSVEKDIILLANLEFNAVTEGEAVATEVADIYVNAGATLTGNEAGLKCTNIVIEPVNSDVTLTAAGTIKVTGKIETKKVAQPSTDPVEYWVGNFAMTSTASVKATTIVTNGLTWANYPVYGTTVE